MKNIIFFSNRIKSFSWILFLLFGLSILAILSSCKDESVSPSTDDQTITYRGDRSEDNFEILGVSCLPDSIYELCDSIPTTVDSMLITLADYPGCTFYVSFEYYECRTDSSSFYHLGSFQLLYHNCSAFTTAFNAAYAAGGAMLAAFVENFDHDVFLQIKRNLANHFVDVGTNPCNGAYSVFMSYIRVSCFQTCIVTTGTTSISFKMACGSDCCAESTSACRDENGNLVLQSAYLSAYPPHCDGPIIYSTGLPPRRCDYEPVCLYACPN